MGICTKVAKRIVQNPSVTRPATHLQMVVSDEYPDYAVVYDPISETVVSVVFRTTEDYVRDGASFVPTASDTRSKVS